ncbi:MAG: ATP synthase F1 subunit gamma [Muribaculaceae bacterium]|nr:ATP synthase F1 subunit gamma [Muribaculaceae bacterium]MBR1725335.1 ATP synthase F1 subunit gamma [Muribaculaceae bacterium]
MATLRELKSRIGSVASTQKTTSAMKMISSAKMRKATYQLQRLSPFRAMVQNVISHLLVTDQEFSSPLIATRDVRRVALVVFGSDDGLCGAFNINLFKHLLATINDLRQQYGSQVGVTVIPVGKKLTKAAMKIAAPDLQVERTALNTRSTGSELSELTTLLRTRFLDGSIDRAEVLYMHFKSTSRQEFMREQMLPVSYESIAQQMDARAAAEPCLFEPDANTIFNSVLPLHLRAMMQEVYTESAASEQASRVMAMQTASDNAKELLDELNLEYNKLRQQSITTELLDIIGGQVQR